MDFNNLLLYVSLLLAILILFSILFGCRYRKTRENFADISKDADKSLNNDEATWMKGIKEGTMSGNDIAKLIQDGKLTKENLSNMIKSCEVK